MQDEICVFTASGEMQAQQIQGFLAGAGIVQRVERGIAAEDARAHH